MSETKTKRRYTTSPKLMDNQEYQDLQHLYYFIRDSIDKKEKQLMFRFLAKPSNKNVIIYISNKDPDKYLNTICKEMLHLAELKNAEIRSLALFGDDTLFLSTKDCHKGSEILKNARKISEEFKKSSLHRNLFRLQRILDRETKKRYQKMIHNYFLEMVTSLHYIDSPHDSSLDELATKNHIYLMQKIEAILLIEGLNEENLNIGISKKQAQIYHQLLNTNNKKLSALLNLTINYVNYRRKSNISHHLGNNVQYVSRRQHNSKERE